MESVSDVKARIQGLAADETAALGELLEANGLTRDELPSNASQVTHLELFLFNYPKITCLDFFPALCSLQITQQDIVELEGLEACQNLQRLWVVESKVERIGGLDQLQKLTQLFLYSNQIAKIEHLEQLTGLETLWLSDNFISSIEGLSTLKRLTELNLARNDITTLGDTLHHNISLRSLNVADNPIGSFNEIRRLTQLTGLSDLCFADPFWGECPVSGLCNYQIYALFTLPQLTSLDTLFLADETKQLAEATYMKKSMYYNMRIRTLRRHASSAARIAADGKKANLAGLAELYVELQLLRKGLQHELAQPRSAEAAAALESKLAQAEAALARRAEQVANLDAALAQSTRWMGALMEEHIHRMLMELETGGNIRMEEGRATDLWHSSCVDLVKSRFSKAEYQPYGIEGITVTRVLRLHNRFLRNRFEQQLAGLTDPSEPSHKQHLEYLFMGENPALPNELQLVVEDGPRSAAEYGALGMDHAVCVSNSICIAEKSRLMGALEVKPADASVGKLLVVKVYLGASTEDAVTLGSKKPELIHKDGKVHMSSLLEGPKVTTEAFPGFDSVYRTRASDSKQKLWYVFDNALVLPEYLVEFQYDIRHSSPLSARSEGGLQLDITSQQHLLEKLDFDVRHIAKPLLPWLEYTLSPGGVKRTHEEKEEERAIRKLLASEPVPAPQQPAYMITDDALKRALPGQSLSAVTYLSLHKCCLRRIEHLEGMAALRTLVLSFNEIAKMEGLQELTALRRLELDHNSIRRIDGMKALAGLEHLELQGNALSRLDDVNSLRKYNSSLVALDLQGNPLAEDKTYRDLVLRRLPYLARLDGLPVTAEARARSMDASGSLSLSTVTSNAVLRGQGLAGAMAEDAPLAESDEWLSSVEQLVVESSGIRRLQYVHKMGGLRKASFADNALSRLDGLEQCLALEELCLENNRLGDVDSLAGLTRLVKLDLGRNKVGSLAALTALTALKLLSVEDNELDSLAGVEVMGALMELYCGNNRLLEFKEVQRLRELPKLIILDLVGNGVCAQEEYRLYVVFNVRKLKVLDGCTIDASEQAAAKSRYAGRLTLDYLEEKIGHKFFTHIRELDISGLRIRDVHSVFAGEEFESLLELNLENNLLTDVSGLSSLRRLVSLKLAGNKVGFAGAFNAARAADRLPSPLNGTASDLPVPAPGDMFPSLQVLDLGSNQISSIATLALSVLTNLRSLNLSGNDISKLEGLEGLFNLQELVLDRNRIRMLDSDSLCGLRRLRELRCEENIIKTVGQLSGLVSLRSLHLAHNRMADLQEVEKLASIGGLAELTLVNNPVGRKQFYRPTVITKLPNLRVLDGLPVTYEEREYAFNMLCPPPAVGQEAPPEQQQPSVVQRGGKMPMRIAAVNFEGVQATSSGVVSVPSIPAGGMVMVQAAGLGLEGFGIRDGSARDGDGGERGRSATTDRRGGAVAAGVRGVREGRQQTSSSPIAKRPSILNRNPRGYS